MTSKLLQKIQRIVAATSIKELEGCLSDIEMSSDPCVSSGSTIVVGETTVSFDDSVESQILGLVTRQQCAVFEDQNTIKSLEFAEGRFVAKISHELRTPLTGIIGLMDLLSATALDSEQSELSTIIQSCADNLLVVVNDLLEFSREKENIDDDLYERFDLRDVINEVVLLLRVRAEEHGNTLEWIVDSDVPVIVEGVHFRLRQILINLVGNAVKFTTDGRIAIEVSMADDFVLIKVTDTGSGIEADRLDDIFKPFLQLERIGSSAGTGLGLAIVQEQVEKLDGEIWAESVVGEGTEFFLKTQFSVGEQPPVDVDGPEVLVVCDGDSTARRIASIVAGCGQNSRYLERPITSADLTGHQILICDAEDRVSIPSINLIERQGMSVPVIVLSNGSDVDFPEFCEVLKKPVRRSTVLSRIARLAGTWHRRVLIAVEDTQSRERLISTVANQRTRIDLVDSLDDSMNLDQYDWVLGDAPSEEFSEAHPTFLDTRTLELETIAEIVAAETQDEVGHVLVADDDAVNRRVVGAYLDAMGITHDFAFDGYAAYKQVSECEYDLILMDCQMPVMDGFESTRRLRKDGFHKPIIALTSMVLRRERGETIESGMDDYLSKPIDRAKFEHVIQGWLQPDESDLVDIDVLNLFIADMESVSVVESLSRDWAKQTLSYFGVERTEAERKRFFHTMKSSARTFGLTKFADFSETSEQLEEAPPGWEQEFRKIFDTSWRSLRKAIKKQSTQQ